MKRPGSDTIISAGDLSINVERHEVTVGDRLVELTLKEFELLQYMMENRGHVSQEISCSTTYGA